MPVAVTSTLAVAATSPLYAYHTVALAEGVYAFVIADPHGALVTSNTLVVIGETGVLVVDTGHFPSLARKMIGDIRRLTDKPVRYVVNTHWHPDHLFGNAAYRDAFPGVVFLAHAETRRLAMKKDPAQVVDQRRTPEKAAKYRKWKAASEVKPGVPLSERDRLAVNATSPELDAIIGDSDVELVPPSVTFDGDGMTVYLGTREVRVLHLGRGNTAGDAVVYVPDVQVLATGDIVVAPYPYAHGSYLGEWGIVLEKLAALDAHVLLPGHGPVEHDLAYVRTLEELIGSVRRQVNDAARAGLSLEETKRKVDISDIRRRITGNDPLMEMEFEADFFTQAIGRAYEEAHGTISDE